MERLNKNHMKNLITEGINATFHKHVIDWDQEHAMVLGEGATAGLFQAIMVKPPNLKNAYSLKKLNMKTIDLPENFKKAAQIAVFNLEVDDQKFSDVMDAQVSLIEKISDSIPVVAVWPEETPEGQREAGRLSIEEENALKKRLETLKGNVIIYQKSLKNGNNIQVKVNHPGAFWVGPCNSRNILAAVGENGMPIFGFKSQKHNSQTQWYTCHKLSEYSVGKEVDAQMGAEQFTVSEHMAKRVAFYKDLVDEEKESKMDLEYWIDYLNLFGIKRKIPLYDHMPFYKYHNLDVFAFLAVVFYLMFRCMAYICCCRCCRSAPAVEEAVKQKNE